MSVEIVHISLVHLRIDNRVFFKQCVSLQNSKIGEVSFLVADGEGDEFVSGVKIIDAGKLKGGRIGRFILGSLKMLKILRSIESDIIHLHDPELLPIGMYLMLKGKTVVYDMHENLPKEILTKPYISILLRYPLSFLLKSYQTFLFRFMPVVFAENSYPKDFNKVRKSVIVLNYPIVNEMEKKCSIQKKEQFTVGYLGGISKERGALMQLNVIEELRFEGYDISTIFIGPISEDVSSAKIYERAISNDWATFTGRVKPEIGWSKISECHVGVAILEPSPNFIESYPTKLFEYMIMGIPCIVSDFPLYRKIVEDSGCGILVDPLDKEKIKEAVEYVYNNPQIAADMGVKGNECVKQKYSWNSEFKKLEELYKDLISNLK